MKNRNPLFAKILLIVFLVGGLGYVGALFIPNNTNVTTDNKVSFKKEGELYFIKEGVKSKKIDIEIAENNEEHEKGLMYRAYLPDSTGMLFIFENESLRNFWMKNTIIPLDIIYLDSNKKIISIAENTTPYSEEGIPSLGVAKYVVEVNAGFTKRNNIQKGDEISF